MAANAAAVAYAVTLAIAAVVALPYTLRLITVDRRILRHPLHPWRISGVDFGLFVVALLLWFVVSSSAVLKLSAALSGERSASIQTILLAGFVLQAGMLAIFLLFRARLQTPNEGTLNPRLLENGSALALGMLAFLASLPFIYTVSGLWQLCLEWLRSLGFDVDLPAQDAVLLFMETDQLLHKLAFVLLAVGVAPVVEEFVFRAGFYRYLKGRFAVSVAVAVSSIAFGLIHGNLHSLPGLITVGACLALSYEFSGNIKVPIAFHAAFNLNSLILISLFPTP